ncbi:FecR family protein [Pseudobacter ginsenosidimutans]|uniref:FecR family protein n=2 Tax=Pseudobacter ginsenosidimutans TaxID=661488 RepID=A0A4Q7MZE2_9BACT|nr:FecR family protein [Pseudobacter ginsenosidimutans]RZS74641.1 FecR family protein [Pseudobacter ginsenosidimutans]
MDQERIKYLLQQFRKQQLTAAEDQELQTLFNDETSADLVRSTLGSMMQQLSMPGQASGQPDWEAMSEQILATDRIASNPPVKNNTKYRRLFIRTAAAAALLACISTAAWFWFRPADKAPSSTIAMEVIPPASIRPGMNGAILTLDDNSQVSLDSAGNGLIADQQGAKVVLQNGALVYDGKEAKAIAWNRMSTPRGRQFHLTLSDGTRVWLNAASSIRYPTRFQGKTRKVEISGEVYFEVANQASSPFIVSMRNGNSVEVLGTSFNLNTYEDESAIRATLLEGSVRVASGNFKSIVLEPGQQAEMGTEKIRVNNADIPKVMAWKNGVFDFEGAGLDEVMRQLSRWYDVEVLYEKNIVPNIKFGGKMSRNMQFENMLKALEMSKVKVKLDNRKLIIQP